MVKVWARLMMILVGASWLSGCAVSPKYTVAKSESDVRQGITVDSGYPGCPDCNKVQTYTSSALAGYAWSYNASADDKGQLTGRIYVGITNNQPNNSNVYFLKIEQTNSGVFTRGASVHLVTEAGNKVALNDGEMNDDMAITAYWMKGVGKDKQCSGNIGFSCWWTDYLMLPTSALNHAIESGRPLTLFIGQTRTIQTTDGFKPTFSTHPIGGTVTVSSEYLKVLKDELVSRGVQLP